MREDQTTAREWPYEEIATAFKVRHIMTPREDFFCVKGEEPCKTALKRMDETDFTKAPVETENARICGIASRGNLPEDSVDPVRGHMVPLGVANTLYTEANLDKAMKWPVEQHFQVVIEGKQVVGLVNIADLNNHPVRSLVSLHCAHLEANLATLVKRQFRRTDQWIDLLSANKQKQIRQRCNEVDSEVRPDLIECANLSHLLEVIQKHAPTRQKIGHELDWNLTKKAGGINELRNHAAHVVRTMIRKPGDVSKLVDRLDRTRSLARAVTEMLREGV